MPADDLLRVARQPEVECVELFLKGFKYWAKRDGGSELRIVICSRLDEDALGAVRELTPVFAACRASLSDGVGKVAKVLPWFTLCSREE